MNEEIIKELKAENRLLRDQIHEVQGRYEEKIAEISMIREVGMSLLHVHSFQRVCRHLMDVIINNTVAKNCSIMLLDQEKNQLYLVCATNTEKESYIIESGKVFSREDAIYSFKVGEGAAGKALLEKRPVLIDRTEKCNDFAQRSKTKVKIGSLLSVPLIIGEDPIGVLNLSHANENIFKTHDVYHFNVLADYIATLMHGALNYERLQQSEAEYRALSEFSNNGIAIIQDDHHHYVNPKYKDLTGYHLKDLKKMPLEALLEISNFNTELTRALSDLKFASGNKLFEARILKKGGGKIDVEISASSVIHNDKRTLILSVLDLTYRKILEKQLVQAQKMQSIGTLAGGIAHNFNNLLMGIQGNASIVLLDTDSNHQHHKNLNNIEKLVKNGSKLTNQLLEICQGRGK